MTSNQIRLGLKENWQQFTLLVVINAFVGGMVGLERSIFPQFAATVFGVTSRTAVLSFIMAFGLSKAMTNYFTGKLASRFGRKKLLVTGWVLAVPIPIILLYAPHWNWVVLANVLLGVSQGLTWSSTVVMKIDLVGEKDRGLAMGLNEFAGYLAVGLMAFVTGYLASHFGIKPYPFYVGLGIALAGLGLSWVLVKDTQHFVNQEIKQTIRPALDNVFLQTSFQNKTLSAITQAGFVNNLNDGMMWGLFPMLLQTQAFDTAQIGILAAAYPVVWGSGQLFTGKMSDIYSKKKMLFWGMLAQGFAILAIARTQDFGLLLALAAVLGLGTALVYPTFLAAIAAFTHPQQRAESLGAFRFWRDLGYAVGALVSGLVADAFGLMASVLLIGAVTVLSAIVVAYRMEK
ncbi:Predicted arabinose efflux permease, MFS family [Flexibacter flexilis DSM 6793]|uniref:Predicted arabinose efflux permease, MFS family n=1 Tax=Flexibacter flexilis DSM 6793 TaxID=927664 RepID=A0A1I1JXR9_9BACT|nr:MFS transporter [Flexibacter flexilis]SFC53306.1 Predicted arabinose efflux permease, MFS family [Flexibacter flexilis DSM 6793]